MGGRVCARGRKGCNGNAGGAGGGCRGVQGLQMGYGIGGGAPTASVPLLPLPARALRANQRHVGAVSAAWPAADGPGQAAREEWAKAESSPCVAVEVGNSTQGSSRRRVGGVGWWGGSFASPPLSAWPYVTGSDCCADVTALFAKFFVLEEMLVA